MSETLTPEELEAQIALRQQRFKQVIGDIRAVLRADLESFVTRETKRAFLEQPVVARALSDAKVAELKLRSAQTGAAAAARIDDALSDESLWTSVTVTPKNSRELNEAAPVWDQVSAIETELTSLLGDFGFSGAAVRYKAPAFFVKGLYLPSLTEHFWRLIQEVGALRRQKQTLVDDSVRSELEARWNDA